MVRPVRFRNSWTLLLFCLSCGPSTKEEKIVLDNFRADTLALENRNGMMYRNGTPFSGRIYQLNANNDTLLIAGYDEGREHGEWKSFYNNGQLEELRYYDKGVKTKMLTRWWENGQMQLNCTFRQGEYGGAFKEWNIRGQLIKVMHYKNGYEEGSQKLFYDNGKIRSNYVVKNGKRIGLLGTKNCVNVSDSIFKK